MFIHKVSINNFKNIHHVNIEFDEHLNKISGNNGAGKSSAIEAIFFSIMGADYYGRGNKDVSELVTKGQDKGSITTTLKDTDKQYLVERSFNTKGDSAVKITATDGTKISANEVKQWISSFTIDPVSFIDAPKKVQFETIQRIAGIDTTEIDNKINEKSGTLYMQRTAQYQIATMKEKARDDMLDSGQQISFTPEVDVSEAMKQLQSINEYNNDLAARQSKLDRMREEIKSMKVQEESIDAELQQLELKKQELISKKNDISTKRADVTQQGINLSKEVTDLDFKSTTEIENRISSAKSITESNQRYNQYQRLKEEAEAERIKWKELDDLIDQLRQQKDDMIKNANYPIEGMRVTEQEGVMINDIPLNQYSSGQQLVYAIKLAQYVLDKPIKVVWLKNAALLDDNALKEVQEFSEFQDYELFIELVGTNHADSILFESGSVA